MNQPLPPYPDYKPAGLPWLEQVPAHWEVKKVKRLFRERSEKGYPDEPLLAATQKQGVVLKTMVGSRTVEASKDFHLLKLVRKGDFVISLRSFEGGIEYAHYQGIISPAYNILTPNKPENAAYFAYLLKCRSFIDSLTLFVTGIREGQNIDYSKFNISFLPVPPLPEQQRIVAFLEAKGRQVARLLRAKRQLIKLLQEQKQALIHRAVTQGLHPEAPRKESGVAWLGAVPAHWEVKRLKNTVNRIDQGVSPQAVGFLADGDSWGVLKSGCVNHGVFRETEHKKLAADFEFDSRIAVSLGDVLISRACGTPALVGSVGKVHILNYNLILSDKLFRPVFKNSVDADFMVYVMNTRYYRQQVEQSISGAEGMANNLPLSCLRDFHFAIPPVEEQKEIVAHLNHSLINLTETISRAQREIELIQEYRTRLVADVVTGRVDVRGVAVAAAGPDAGEELLDEEEVGEEELVEEEAQEVD